MLLNWKKVRGAEMVLDWKKVAVILVIAGTFVALAIAHKLPDPVIISGTSAMLGWVGGLFTPTPKNKTVIVNADDNIN